MANDSSALVQKLWNYCNVLRDDGVSYGDYVEQLTYLLFLKMDDEQTRPPFNRKSKIPAKYNWNSLLDKDGDELEVQYAGDEITIGFNVGYLLDVMSTLSGENVELGLIDSNSSCLISSEEDKGSHGLDS